MSGLSAVSSLKTCIVNVAASLMRPTRNHGTYVGWDMKKDQKRRLCVKEHSMNRTRLVALKRCNLLPPELREVATNDIIALPRDSNYIRLRNRCYVTSRPRALIQEFRVSRIIFRHLADYNQLCGVQRAMCSPEALSLQSTDTSISCAISANTALREKHLREHRRHRNLSPQSNHTGQEVSSQSVHRAKSPLNLSATAAAALAAEKRAAAAARKAADQVALVPWNADDSALIGIENNVRRSISSLFLPRSLLAFEPSNSIRKQEQDTVQLKPNRCISPRTLRLAREFSREAQEYDRRRQRMQRANALIKCLQPTTAFQSSCSRTPRSAVHKPSASFAPPTTQTKPFRRETARIGGHRLGDSTDMERNPILKDVSAVHRRYAVASVRVCGRTPATTGNSLTGNTASIVNDSQTVALRTCRQVQPRPICVPNSISTPQDGTQTTQTQPKNYGGAWNMLAARHAARNKRKVHSCTHAPNANRTFPKTETVEITRLEDEGAEAAIPGASRELEPLSSETNPSNDPPTNEQSTEPRRSVRVVGRRDMRRSSSLPVAPQSSVDRPSAVIARNSYARRRPDTRTILVKKQP